jgi:hypothetical protein
MNLAGNQYPGTDYHETKLSVELFLQLHDSKQLSLMTKLSILFAMFAFGKRPMPNLTYTSSRTKSLSELVKGLNAIELKNYSV